MCILFVHTDPKPPPGGYRLIVASNRDEFYVRKAKQAEFCERSGVIGGRDMHGGREGGMWLGVATKATNAGRVRIGALLNVTGEDRKEGVQGRGFIVADYLAGDLNLVEYIDVLSEKGPHNAFNLVTVEISEDGKAKICHHSNLQEDLFVYEGKQTLGFGNSNPKVPYKKVVNGVKRFESIINESKSQAVLVKNLLGLLKWEEQHLPDAELERRAPQAFEGLSSVFVNIPQAGYGTRTHSIVLVDEQWNLTFIEETMQEPVDLNQPTWINKQITSHL